MLFFLNLRHVLLNSGDRRISSAIIDNLQMSLYYTEVITHKISTLVRLSKISRGKLEKLFSWRNLAKKKQKKRQIQYVVLNRTRRMCSVYFVRMDSEEYRKCWVCQFWLLQSNVRVLVPYAIVRAWAAWETHMVRVQNQSRENISGHFFLLWYCVSRNLNVYRVWNRCVMGRVLLGA